MSNSNNVPKLYRSVIEEVIKNVKEAFLNEGVDEQVLQELKQIWENKLLQSRAVDGMPADNQQARQQYMYPHIVQNNPGLHVPVTSAISRPQQQVAISHAPTVQIPVPSTINHRPGTAGQTAIIFPESRAQAQTHVHALSQMTAAASAATLALPGMQQVQGIQQPQRTAVTQVPTAYPTARTIQVTHTQQQQQQLQQNQHQQQQTAQVTTNKPPQMIIQVDGVNDSDSDGDDDDDFGDDQDEEDNERNVTQELEEEPEKDEELNSGDDDSDDGATDLFDTENVVVCQFDKIARSRNKWKFHLKDGIMNLKGRDYVFQKATGEAEW
ncbi:transcription initiation factor IIA subunit 1-like [Actinia tenebrosa]|uniref:Transcription initiation factor IIA subunit 1-like n=1 Tax=Actinia tenebrosa TaxID=6105 RepID=A0A6P8IHQ7_ACTTE|nr:transcription initiation factor IIA subunit 1-like [Actinia tenebrosa]